MTIYHPWESGTDNSPRWDARPETTAPRDRPGGPQIAEGGFAEYFEPFTGEPLGSRDQSWTAAVALDWLAYGPLREMRAA